MTITLNDLMRLNACYAQQALFKKLFPSGKARVTMANCRIAYEGGLTIAWLLDKLLWDHPLLRVKFNRCDQDAEEAYEAIMAPARLLPKDRRAEYKKCWHSAMEAYQARYFKGIYNTLMAYDKEMRCKTKR